MDDIRNGVKDVKCDACGDTGVVDFPLERPPGSGYVMGYRKMRCRCTVGASFKGEVADKVILVNKARCRRCNTVMESKHRHDFVSCPCGHAVDGGQDYLRRLGRPEDLEELSEFEEAK